VFAAVFKTAFLNILFQLCSAVYELTTHRVFFFVLLTIVVIVITCVIIRARKLMH